MHTTEERRVAAAKWSNAYCQRMEEVLEQHANELHEMICRRVEAVGWDEVKETKGGWWLIFPVIQAYNIWFEKLIEPLVLEATGEFRRKIGLDPDWRKGESVIGNATPIGVREMERKYGVKRDKASRFFNKHFSTDTGVKGHRKYTTTCRRNPGKIATWLKQLSGDYSPHPVFDPSSIPGE